MKRFQAMLVLSVLIMIIAACGAPPEPVVVATEPPSPTQPAEKPFRVAVLMPSAVNDLAFSQSMYDSLLRVQEDMGGPVKMEFVYSQGMFIIEDAASAIRTYASQDYDLVIAHGSQYGESLKEIAPEFPETSFAWGTTLDTFGIPNIFAYEAASQEGGYVNGVLAANLTTSNVIGIIGPIETGDAKLYVDGFKAGVMATDPEMTVHVEYIGSFSDVVLASETATRFISEGADVLTGTAQMVVGATSIANENNALWFGTQSNQSSLAPSIVVASQVYHWEVVLKQIIDNIESGTTGGRSYTLNLGNGGEVIEYNPEYSLSEDIKGLAENTIRGIINGNIKVNLP